MPDAPDSADAPQSGTSLTLLQRMRDGDDAAWQTMVRIYSPLVAHWCRRSSIPAGDVDDALQAVFRVASTNLERFRRDRPGDTFRGWLRGITRNIVLEQVRRSGRQPRAAGGTEALLRLQDAPEADP